jgi:hypothetical protein
MENRKVEVTCYISSTMPRARRAQAQPKTEPDAAAFWHAFAIALDRVEEYSDDNVRADALVRFLKGHRQTWSAIMSSMRASADRRAMIERACLLLAERKTDGGLAS